MKEGSCPTGMLATTELLLSVMTETLLFEAKKTSSTLGSKAAPPNWVPPTGIVVSTVLFESAMTETVLSNVLATKISPFPGRKLCQEDPAQPLCL